MSDWVTPVCQTAQAIRLRVFDHVLKNNGGYMSQACSSAELFATLYQHLLHLGPSQAPMIPVPFPGVPGSTPDFINGGAYNGPHAPDLDRFIFSPAHYALVLYSTLIEVGRLAPEGLAQFNLDGSTVEMIGAEHSPGVETTTGSLGQAISQAGGIALARKLRGDTGRVWVMMTDGEFQEGQVWEAFATLSHYQLDNVIVVVDANGQQCDGRMSDVMTIEPLAARLEAFGACAVEVDGHNPAAIASAALDTPHVGQPLVIIARTDPCRGLEVLRQRDPNLHYLRFKSDEERDQYRQAYLEMKVSAAHDHR